MTFKIIGAMIILGSCGMFGLRMVREYKEKANTLEQLVIAINYMLCELEYHRTPLPLLCRQASAKCRGTVSELMGRFAAEMESQIVPDAKSCMLSALEHCKKMSLEVETEILQIGDSVGLFDLSGQLNSLTAVKQHCLDKLSHINRNRENRLRGYQTIALCAGAALVILLF